MMTDTDVAGATDTSSPTDSVQKMKVRRASGAPSASETATSETPETEAGSCALVSPSAGSHTISYNSAEHRSAVLRRRLQRLLDQQE